MQDMLQIGSEWLSGQRHEHLAHAVLYSRAAQSVTVRATPDRGRYEGSADAGLSESWETQDYLLRAEDLVLGGAKAVPAAGDTILDGTGNLYEVCSPGGGIAVWEWEDVAQLDYRVHCKRVAAV